MPFVSFSADLFVARSKKPVATAIGSDRNAAFFPGNAGEGSCVPAGEAEKLHFLNVWQAIDRGVIMP